MITVELIQASLQYDPETGKVQSINPHPQRRRVEKRKRERVTVAISGRSILAHRAAWVLYYGEFPKGEIDHINGDEGDNRITNLRDVSKSENQQNKRRPRVDNKVGLLGVSWHAQGRKWRAQITVGGVRVYLGIFSTPEAAHDAYLAAKRQLHPGCAL